MSIQKRPSAALGVVALPWIFSRVSDPESLTWNPPLHLSTLSSFSVWTKGSWVTSQMRRLQRGKPPLRLCSWLGKRVWPPVAFLVKLYSVAGNINQTYPCLPHWITSKKTEQKAHSILTLKGMGEGEELETFWHSSSRIPSPGRRSSFTSSPKMGSLQPSGSFSSMKQSL